MATTIPIYETERGNEGGDVKVIPEVADLNTVIDRLNAVSGTFTKVAASLVTGLVVDNNAILWTAVDDTVDGNDIDIVLIAPPATDTDLSVEFVGNDVIVSLAKATGAVTSTASDVIAAVAADASVSAVVTAVNDSTSDGSGVVAAVDHTPLSGGTGYNDLPHPVAS